MRPHLSPDQLPVLNHSNLEEAGVAQGLPVVRHAQRPEAPPACDLVVGVSGWRKNGAAAVVLDGRLEAFCEQERLTRVRRDPLKGGELPSATVDSVLALVSRRPSSVDCYVVGEPDLVLPGGHGVIRLDHHYAHAAPRF